MKSFLIFVITFSFVSSHADLRDSARELLQEGQRGKAYELLLNGLTVKNSKLKNKSIKKELKNLSNIFVSEKSQKYFQQALTLFYAGDKNYKSKLKKAEDLEPENLKIIFTKAWLMLVEKKCSKAKGELNKIKKLNIQYEDLSVVEFYMNLCEKKADAECGGFSYDTKESLREKVLKLATCRSKDGSSARLNNYCKLLKIDVPRLPEIGLWCSSESDRVAKYKSACDSLNKEGEKRNLLEIYPFLCEEKISSHVIGD